jgi:Fe(3+) dicitrate transport protein
MINGKSGVVFAAVLATAGLATGQDALTTLESLVVTAESEADGTNQQGWLPAISGASIFSGKKTAVIDLDAQPQNVGNNYRQALAQTPSLVLVEESSPLISIGYRGLNPHRAQFTQVLRDGIPIHADQFGYPEAYYTPPLDTVDRIEFLHGGAALHYGPQPGGALNYITHRPRTDKEFSVRSEHVVGSDDLYSTFTSVDGTLGKLGYYGYFNHRETDGFRSANSGYDLDTGAIKLLYALDNGGKIIFNAGTYTETHGEPGGLTRAAFNAGSRAATRLFDEFRLDRDSVSLTYEVEPTVDSFFTTTAWWSDYTRFSKRQRGGGFGTLPPVPVNPGDASATNSIEDQQFETLGIDSRYRANWGADRQHTFAAGVQLYHVDSPRVESRGATPDASSGTVRKASDRELLYAPVFVENKFTFGKFSITPGLRLENFRQEVNERINVEKPGLASKKVSDNILLGGLGAEYATDERSAIYGNISQGYRPQIFTEAVPLNSGQVINDDLAEGKSLEYEIGYRTRPRDWLSMDASVFLLSFEDQIGTVGNTVENVGDAVHKGIDLSVSADLLGLVTDTDVHGALNWYVNATLLDAEFTDGPNDGFEPQYAPDFILRTGFIYSYKDKTKVSLGGTFVADHSADNAANPLYDVPAYMVWDLTAEYRIHENLRLVAGINNLFDESYFTRVRSDGIDPSNGRNCYFGASLEF